MLGAIVSQCGTSVSHDLDKNTHVLSRVLFQSEDKVEVEEIPESLVTPSSPISPNFLDVLYVGTPTHMPTRPAFSPSFLSMATIGKTILAICNTSVHTPLSVEGGGTIAISSIIPSIVVFFSTSIPSLSGGTQYFSSHTDSFPYGIPSSEIPSIPLTISFFVNRTMNSMASGLASFQGFPSRSGYIPHSDPYLNIISLPFSA